MTDVCMIWEWEKQKPYQFDLVVQILKEEKFCPAVSKYNENHVFVVYIWVKLNRIQVLPRKRMRRARICKGCGRQYLENRYPERGRKQYRLTQPLLNLNFYLENRYPERGRKHFYSSSLSSYFESNLENRYPERGRKLVWLLQYQMAYNHLFGKQIPREGTETVIHFFILLYTFRIWKIDTPRGDGNIVIQFL